MKGMAGAGHVQVEDRAEYLYQHAVPACAYSIEIPMAVSGAMVRWARDAGADRMNIHEYQGKELLRGYGVAVLDGYVAWTPEEAEQAAAKLPGPITVVKAQIHAGGRGAGHFAGDAGGKGGVRLAKTPAEARAHAEAMIGNTLVTKQTGEAGRRVSRVYVEAGCDIKRELYVSLLVDRETSRITIVASTEGGMEIEHVAETTPDKILRAAIDPAAGVSGFHARKLAFGLGLEGKQVAAFTRFVLAMYKAFTELDCAVVEVNPLVVTAAGEVVALDAKVSFDDNALYKHPQLETLRDEAEEDPKELEAAKYSLNYVALDGTIGCMVNGAGAGDGDDGHHQAVWRVAGQLPGRGRRRHQGAGDGGVQDSSCPIRTWRASWSTSSAASCGAT